MSFKATQNSAFPPAAGKVTGEPRWRPADHYSCATLGPGIRRWLTDDGSLTSRLISLGQGEFSVQRLYQGWQVPRLSERQLLGMAGRQVALVREVALRLDGRAVVFARSVFPYDSLCGSLGHLRRLQNKSLGAILFKHPGMHRCPFELAPISGDSSYLPSALHQQGPAWGRRSRFEIEGGTLMVSEVFLENFSPWPATLPVHRSQRGRVVMDKAGTEITPATR